MAPVKRRLNLLWLQSGGCGGCSMSLLGAEGPDILTLLDAAGIDVLWHPALSLETGLEVTDIFDRVLSGHTPLDFFCLEGSVIRGPNGSGRFHLVSGYNRPMMDLIAQMAAVAAHVIAVGSCAAYGGVTAAGANVVEACGLAYDGLEAGGLLGAGFLGAAGLPVINIAGCPIHPGWLTDTLTRIALGTLAHTDLDEWERPLSYTNHLVHHGCSRNEFYEFKASGEKLSDLGCMMENLGCKGTQARADCNIRPWNGSGSCIDGGYPCINCTSPRFEEPGHIFTATPKIGGIPIGLPTDMPKAWFVALAALSKAATPTRLKVNAVHDRVAIPPHDKKKEGG